MRTKSDHVTMEFDMDISEDVTSSDSDHEMIVEMASGAHGNGTFKYKKANETPEIDLNILLAKACSKGVTKIDESKQELTLPGLVCQTGNGQTGNGQTGNGQTGNGKTGNGQTGNDQTGNGQTGNGQTGNGQTGNGQTGNGQTGYVQMVDRMEIVMVIPKVDGPVAA
ncbi:unnamed protein product [Mytilus edulis]|uniref:Uncharacterized protein n=1 Tax=Mytilus edulis TaxID=6550 RepID=A0A8S3TK61_MYTED|nr:unnamed protein product [Mytilus edulis]